MSQSSLLSFSDAKQRILQEINSAPKLKAESVALFDAVNRIAAAPIISPMNVPSFNNSAMDGYAVRKADIEAGIKLPIANSVFAGSNQRIDWPKASCLRIMTGAPVPDDTYAVIMQEDVNIDDNHISFDATKLKQGQNIRYIGESVKKGAEIFPVGEKLTIPKLSTLATLGIQCIDVYLPIKVAIFSTGDELTPIGELLPNTSSIYDSNRFTIHLMLKALGCEVIDLGIIKDDLALIANTLKQAATLADVVITSGGVSVGDADYTKMALTQIGQVNFWKIAMKPGKPFAFGRINHALFCGLPGNPVSTLVTFYQFVRPLILRLYGQQTSAITTQFTVKTTSKLKKSIGRIDFQRGYFYADQAGEMVVESAGEQGSHITSSFNQANCFIVLERERGNVAAGETVTIEPFDAFML